MNTITKQIIFGAILTDIILNLTDTPVIVDKLKG